MKQRIMVTGSGGFLGRRLVKLLQSAGHSVVPYDKCLGQDIQNQTQLQQTLIGCDACIHLAAVSDLYIAEEDPEACARINVEGTQKVAVACFAQKSHLLYASTCCVYGNNGCDISSEISPVAPTELYAQTKLEGELEIKASQCKYTILRIGTFYGPGTRTSLATYKFLKSMVERNEVLIHGDGTQTRCYTHVDDVASGILAVLENRGRLIGKTINIADNIPYSVNQLVDIIETKLETVATRHYISDRPGQIRSSAIDNSFLRSLGWRSSCELSFGIEELIKRYFSH